MIDVDALRHSEEQLGFLLRLSDALRPVSDPVEIQSEACRMLAEWLDVDRAYYIEVDEHAGVARVDRDYVRNGAMPLASEHALADFGWSVDILRRGECYVIPDVRASPLVPDADRPASLALDIISCMGAPLIKGGRLVGALCVTAPRPREWTEQEVATLQEVAERIWAAVGHARAEAALRASEERQAFLLGLSDILRPISDAVEIQTTAMKRLAGRLDVVRAAYFEVGADQDSFSLTARWEAPGTAALPARMSLTDFGPDIREGYRAGRTQTVRDTERDGASKQSRTAFRAIDVRALIGVPLVKDGRLLTVVGVHSRTPRDWTAAEIRVVEEVAERTWDAVERARAQSALRESEARFRALVNATSYAVYRMSPDWREMRQLDGRGFLRDTPEPTTDWLAAYIDPADQPEVMAAIQAAIDSKSAFRLEHRVRRPDGTLGWTYSRAVPLVNESGEIVEWFGAASDVTERRQAEEAVRNAELRLRIAEEAAGVGTFDWLIESNKGRWSPELLNMLGLQDGALGGSFEDWIGLIYPDDRPEATRSIGIALESGVLEGEWRVVRADGETLWVLVRGIVERDDANRPKRMTGAQVDITEHKLSEQQVQLLIAQFESQIEEIRRQFRPGET